MKEKNNWTVEIVPEVGWFHFNLREVWLYRDLMLLFVRRDVVTIYKQTILGPLWFIIQPIFTALMFTLVFGRIAKISTDGIPSICFYLLGITFWSFFSECLTKISNVFIGNQDIFGKVYFPRIVVPFSIVISNLYKFLIQFCILLAVCGYYYWHGDLRPNIFFLIFPFVLFILALISMGLGMLFSAFTSKYRDLVFLLNFSIQLWMYSSPIIYPMSAIPPKYQTISTINPIAPLIESLRFGFLGKGTFDFYQLSYSVLFAFIAFLIGLVFFSKTEKKFLDTV